MRKVFSDKVVAILRPEMAEYRVQLSQAEIAVLEEARKVCEKAEELEGEMEGCYESDFGWADVYLSSILEEQA